MRKTAIIISGHVRDFERTLPLLVDLTKRFDGDVFIASYKNRAVGVRFWQGQKDISDSLTQEDYNLIDQELKPKYSVFSDAVDIPYQLSDYSFKNRQVSIKGVYSMFYKIWESNQLKLDYESKHNFKYDVVIRTRFDNEYIQLESSSLAPDTVITARSEYKAYMTDTFFLSSSTTMNKICGLVNEIGTILPSNRYYNAEHMLTEYCSLNNLQIITNGNIQIKLRDKYFS